MVKYKDLIKYISCSESKDRFGYGSEEAVDKYVRYCGGKEVYKPKNNILTPEYRLIYYCPFEVKVNDKFVIDNDTKVVKESVRKVDVSGRTVHWRVEVA